MLGEGKHNSLQIICLLKLLGGCIFCPQISLTWQPTPFPPASPLLPSIWPLRRSCDWPPGTWRLILTSSGFLVKLWELYSVYYAYVLIITFLIVILLSIENHSPRQRSQTNQSISLITRWKPYLAHYQVKNVCLEKASGRHYCYTDKDMIVLDFSWLQLCTDKASFNPCLRSFYLQLMIINAMAQS